MAPTPESARVSDWRELLPGDLGPLPLAGRLVRTEPAGSPRAAIAVLGTHPGVVAWSWELVEGQRIRLPIAVEPTSFHPDSRNGAMLAENLLRPLGLSREELYLLDMFPYYLASTGMDRRTGHSLWQTVQWFSRRRKVKHAVRPRPGPGDLLRWCREKPGYQERLRELLGSCAPGLVITLGPEPAALLRGCSVAEAERAFYGEPERCEGLGLPLFAVHLAHPAGLRQTGRWLADHEAWLERAPELLRIARPAA